MPSNTIFVGLCTGLLAAAALSASESVLDLVTNACTVVRIAFRIGVKVNDAGRRVSIAEDDQVNQQWSRLVFGVQKDASLAEITEFNKSKVRKHNWYQVLTKS